MHKEFSSNFIKVLLVLFLTLAISAVSAFTLVNAALATPTSFPVHAWGRNDHGQLGVGHSINNVSMPVPAPLPAGVRGWSEFYIGPLHNMAIATDGRLFAWGLNDFGQLGIGSTANSYNTPQALPFPASVNDWQDVQLGLGHTLALCVDGRLFAWGRNHYGQLGIGSTINHNTPQPVPLPTGVDYWIAIAAQSSSPGHSLAIANTGQLFAWGNNQHGQLGLGGPVPGTIRNTPQPVPFPTAPIAVDGWSRVYTGQGHTLAICTNGNLFSWGQNQYGQLGLGGPIPGLIRNTPQPVARPAELPNWDTLYVGTNYVRAITPDGRFIGWGQRNAGQLGVDSNNNPLPVNTPPGFSTPQMGHLPAGITGWYRVFSGNNHTLAVTHPCAEFPHGRWFAWGWNMGGRLGLGSGPVYLAIENRLTPTEITHNMPIPPESANWTAFLATHTALVILAPRDPQAHLVKTLEMNEGTLVPYPLPSFIFNFEAIGITPDIPPQTVAIRPNTATTADGVTTLTAELNLWRLIQSTLTSAGVSGGVWTWEVTEEVNSSSINASSDPNTMTYDRSRFQVNAHTNSHGILEALVMYRMVESALGEWERVEPKLDDIEFVNTYTRIVGDEQAALYISKNVVGVHANLTTPFEFSLTLTNPVLSPGIGSVTAEVVNATTGAFIRELPTPITAGVNEFTLAHNEKLRIPELPAGTRFQITEAQSLEFRPQASVTAIPVAPATGAYPMQDPNTELVTLTYIIHQEDENRASFINTHVESTPTGLLITTAPWVAAVVAALMLALMLASRSRKRIETLPLMVAG